MHAKTKSKSTSGEADEFQIIEEKITKSNGDIGLKTYTRGKLLGKGGFASVYEFLCVENKQLSAGKIISKNSLAKARARQKLMFEIKIHRSLHHTNIVRFDRFFEDQENVYIILEICVNQTLTELMRRRKRLLEIEIQCYLIQLVAALKYLHAHRVIHRDIKLGNIFLNDKMEIKLGDFGLATKLEFDGERKSTICGTPNYIAPEILEGKYGHSYEVDLWSLGVLIYTLCYGLPPFETNDIKMTYRKIKSNAYTFHEQVYISEELKDLIASLLVNNPANRLTLDQVLDHPFTYKCPVPKLLPVSTLAVPPSGSYLKQFQQDGRSSKSPLNKCLIKSSSQCINVDRLVTCRQDEEKSNEKNKSDTSAAVTSRNRSSNAELITNRKLALSSSYTFSEGGPKVWIKKWVDYSNKYGLGYILSNGQVGIYFNDATKIISEEKSFYYISYNDSTKEDSVTKYSYDSFPAEIRKKLTLLEHFRKYLEIDESIEEKNEIVYVKKWMLNDHATVFRLSNRVVQIRFTDRSEILLCSISKTVTYIDRSGKIEATLLRNAMESKNKELAKRLKYTTEMLNQMAAPQASRK